MEGQSFLIVVDAFSKWLEVVRMKSTTTETTIRALRRIFATHGLPDVLVSDNGPQFTNKDFELFLTNFGIRHALVSPHHAASNGEAEIFVKLTKLALKRMSEGGWQHRIDEFLLMQHITPNTTTGKSPAELLMGRRLRNKLDRLHPDYIEESINTDKTKGFSIGDKVYAKNYGDGPTWVPGEITAVTGPRSYRLQIPEGKIWKRHRDQVRNRVELPENETQETEIMLGTQAENTQSLPEFSEESSEDLPELGPTTPGTEFQKVPGAGPDSTANPSLQVAAEPQNELRRSSREKKRPEYLRDYVTD